MCKKGTVILFPSCVVILSPSCAVFQTSVSSVFSIIMCCVLVRSSGGVPVGGMAVSALETLIQACVHDGLGGAVARPQSLVSHLPSQFGVKSLPAAVSSAEVVIQEQAAVVSHRLFGFPVWQNKANLVRN